MPAAAVTPAPIAYIKVVAVKKLVVELESVLGGVGLGAFSAVGRGRLRGFCLAVGGCYSKQAKFPNFPKGFNPCLRSLDALYCCVLASQNILP